MRMTGNVNLHMTTVATNNIKDKVAPNGNNLVGMQSFATSVSDLVTIMPTVIYNRKPDRSYTNHLHDHILTDHPNHPVGSTNLHALIPIALLFFGLRTDVLVDLAVARTSNTTLIPFRLRMMCQ